MTTLERLKELAPKFQNNTATLEESLEQDRLFRSLSSDEIDEFVDWLKEN